ncbi:hypothetical protein AVEN_138704-1 [Araneus ventricosus]|uniref:Uncharacterized protein n=1 Tax=Araneus ventricosus TaxID=182803 RepID=A0A4Y2GGB0_ARAVE|nr:hypothetical protein AVEN_138704-1 [Araneus ventricosus]
MTRTAPELGAPSSNFHASPTGGRLATIPRHHWAETLQRFEVQQAPYTADCRRIRVSSLKPSGIKAETLPRGLFEG